MTSSEHEYTMSISLNVLNHLGLNLYSTIPAVLTEAVANAWDAGATNVDVSWESEGTGGALGKISRIEILDDGTGMTREDVRSRYLTVGYRRRQAVGGTIVIVPAADGADESH